MQSVNKKIGLTGISGSPRMQFPAISNPYPLFQPSLNSIANLNNQLSGPSQISNLINPPPFPINPINATNNLLSTNLINSANTTACVNKNLIPNIDASKQLVHVEYIDGQQATVTMAQYELMTNGFTLGPAPKYPADEDVAKFYQQNPLISSPTVNVNSTMYNQHLSHSNATTNLISNNLLINSKLKSSKPMPLEMSSCKSPNGPFPSLSMTSTNATTNDSSEDAGAMQNLSLLSPPVPKSAQKSNSKSSETNSQKKSTEENQTKSNDCQANILSVDDTTNESFISINTNRKRNHTSENEGFSEDSNSQSMNRSLTSSPNCSSIDSDSHLIKGMKSGSIVDDVDVDALKKFAGEFKLRRFKLGLTQNQVCQQLQQSQGVTYSQSAICRFENLDITAKSAKKIKPVLEQWLISLDTAGEEKIKDEALKAKKRKKRTNFKSEEQKILFEYFKKTQKPSQEELVKLSHQLNRPKNEIQVWFNNRRQSLRPQDKKSEPPPILRNNFT